jgi:hypothetical protein
LKKDNTILTQHIRLRPGFFQLLFKTKPYRIWQQHHNSLLGSFKKVDKDHRTNSSQVSNRENIWNKNHETLQAWEKRYAIVTKTLAEAKQKISIAQKHLKPHFVDTDFFDLPHAEFHQVSPWCDSAMQHLRDDVFITAIKLQKAFIDAAAKPLRHNLGALMMVFSGRSMPDEEKLKLLPDLWASLFLVVPGISTTFASVERMFGGLPPESLGWLLIDEAGQALPQAAVGAIMRTKRAVVVGDPIQVEPVVVLPPTLTQNICKKFGIDPDYYNAPDASAQTLADTATPYFATFETKYGSRSVGVPLLVHRRCEEPMFSISNAVAYQGLMVQAKRPGVSQIRNCLGPSKWINIQGESNDKWCPQEGAAVLDLLRRLKAGSINPDLYIVTPFVIVADNLRRIIIDSGILKSWTDNDYKWCFERIGTIHTVQGREAEAVIFVLGAPSPSQTGARGWAGGKPNLLNVAVTRAKEVLYVIGNKQLWSQAGLFKELADRI